MNWLKTYAGRRDSVGSGVSVEGGGASASCIIHQPGGAISQVAVQAVADLGNHSHTHAGNGADDIKECADLSRAGGLGDSLTIEDEDRKGGGLGDPRSHAGVERGQTVPSSNRASCNGP